MNNKKEDKPNRQVAEQGNSIPKKRKKKGKKRVLLTILMVFLLICLVACLAVGIYVISIAAELPDITAEDLVQAQTSFVYDQMERRWRPCMARRTVSQCRWMRCLII